MELLTENFAQWVTPAQDAFNIALRRPGDNAYNFPPEYTFFMFPATEDNVFGYKDPQIRITFRAYDMKPSIQIESKGKMNLSMPGADKFVEIPKILEKFFPAEAFTSDETGLEQPSAWKPPGEKLHEYTYEDKRFEIWSATLADKRAIEIVKNMKILIPMFIETGTINFLDDDENDADRWALERWRVFLVYEVDSRNDYLLAGFSTSYNFWVFLKSRTDDEELLDEQDKEVDESSYSEPDDFAALLNAPIPSQPNTARERISQFIILPPYQHQNHGINLYQTMMSLYLTDSRIFEVTVEDPNESFDNLRDYCDLSYLLTHSTSFRSIKPVSTVPNTADLSPKSFAPIDDILSPTIVSELCTKHKLIERQVERLIEMYLLSQIPPAHRLRTRVAARKWKSSNEHDRQYYFWRLMVKHRVWLRNRESLKEFEENERVEKIEGTVDFQQEGYVQLLEGFEKRVEAGYLTDRPRRTDAYGGAERTVVLNGGSGATRKRKVIESSSDEDDEVPAKRQATEPLS
jgi:histone acetyltransferase 1